MKFILSSLVTANILLASHFDLLRSTFLISLSWCPLFRFGRGEAAEVDDEDEESAEAAESDDESAEAAKVNNVDEESAEAAEVDDEDEEYAEAAEAGDESAQALDLWEPSASPCILLISLQIFCSNLIWSRLFRLADFCECTVVFSLDLTVSQEGFLFFLMIH